VCFDTRQSPAESPFTGIDVKVANSCGVPGSAQAYVMNATTVSAGVLGFLSLWPQGQSRPLVSTLNSSGGVASNLAIVPTNNGLISVYGSQQTDLILDIFGYFAP